MSTLPVPQNEPEALTPPQDVNQLAARVAALEARLPANSWLFGNSFIKRVFAIWGHYFVAQLIIGIVIGILFLACTLLFTGLLGNVRDF